MDWLKMCGSDTSTNSRSPPGAAACPAMKRGSALALPRRSTRVISAFFARSRLALLAASGVAQRFTGKFRCGTRVALNVRFQEVERLVNATNDFGIQI